MTNTFDRMGELYDLMVPWESRLSREAPFFRDLFGPDPKRILDAACGTGRHALLFHDLGHQVVGTDISEGVLGVARRNAEAAGASLSFIREDFCARESCFAPGSFQAVTAIGNVLALFTSPDELARVFRKARSLLSPGGKFVFQMMNFHSAKLRHERFTPLRSAHRDGEELLFQKFFDFSACHVVLNLLIFIKGEEGWTRRIEISPLMPWTGEAIIKASREAGFLTMDMYGDYSGIAYDADTSRDIIGCATSPQGAYGAE
jgi:SAM-dependent methyltransferase